MTVFNFFNPITLEPDENEWFSDESFLMLDAHQHYIKFGIRTITQLYSATRFFDNNLFHLPKNSSYHYFHGEPPAFALPEDDAIFAGFKKAPIIRFITEMTYQEGHPRHVQADIKHRIINYHTKNAKLKKYTNDSQDMDSDQQLTFYSYVPLKYVYRYQHNFLMKHNDWANRFKTMIDHIVSMLNRTTRNIYFHENVPEVIPSMSQVEHIMGRMDQSAIKIMRDDEHAFFLLELLKWVSSHREASLLSPIPLEKAHLVNIVYNVGGKFCILNLGMLNSFRESMKGDDANYFYKERAACKPEQLLRRVLVFYMELNALRLATVKGAAPIIETPEEDISNAPDQQVDDVPIADNEAPLETEKPANAPIVDRPIGLETSNNDEIDLESLDSDELKAHHQEIDNHLNEKLSTLDTIQIKDEEELDASIKDILDARNSSDRSIRFKQHCDKLLQNGVIDQRSYKRLIAKSESYKTDISPDGKRPIHEYITLRPEDHKIPQEKAKLKDIVHVLDKSMLDNTLQVAQNKYNKEILPRHIASMIYGIQDAGYAISNLTSTRVHDITGDYITWTFKVLPIEGEPATLKVNTYDLDDNGEFKSNGVSYRLKLQRGEYPIVKISPNEVALNSYYGTKLFVQRSRNKVDDYGNYLRNKINVLALDPNSRIKNILFSYSFDRTLKCAYAYSCISHQVESLQALIYHIDFNHEKAVKKYPPEIVAKFEKKGQLVIGYNTKDASKFVVMDNIGYVYETNGDNLVPIDMLESLLGIDLSKAPIEFAAVGIFGQEIPVIVPLSLQYGLSRVLKIIKAKYQKYPSDQKIPYSKDRDYIIKFKDVTLVFERANRYQQLIIAGLLQYEHLLENYTLEQFDTRGVYISIMEAMGISIRYIREMELLHDLFVDPITREYLEEMKEPIKFDLLLLRACELLVYEEHPRELEGSLMRVKGYERMAGFLYQALVESAREHKSKMNRATARMNLNPFSVMTVISEDSSKELISEINPIHGIKTRELMTYGGTGGRDRQTMVKRTRIYKDTDQGLVSEASPDNGDVGINTILAAAPTLKSTQGDHIPHVHSDKNVEAARYFSTPAMLAPFSDTDDMKRVNFVSVQRSHVVPCESYHQSQVQTGYENIIAYKAGLPYVAMAKQDGVVKTINNNGIIVEYKDGTSEGYKLGRHYGIASGLTIPHELITLLKEGDKFKADTPIAYNKNFFEPSFFNPKYLAFKNTLTALTIFNDSKETLEDSSLLSANFAKRIQTKITKQKNVTIDFSQDVKDLVEEGSSVSADDVLCYILEPSSVNLDNFSDEVKRTLRDISRKQPRAGSKGVVEKIEVYYNGDPDDASDTLKEIIESYDRKRKKLLKEEGKEPYSGKVDGGFRIDASAISPDTAVIKFYITKDQEAGSGDKGVVSNQLKTVFAGHMHDQYKTEDGRDIDVVFGYSSAAKRIVNSAFKYGATVNLLNNCRDKMVKIYFG